MDPELFNLFQGYYLDNEKLMSDFQDDGDVDELNQSMAKLDDQFVEEYFVRTGERIDRDKIADIIADALGVSGNDEDNQPKK